jgi:hypothetical protein
VMQMPITGRWVSSRPNLISSSSGRTIGGAERGRLFGERECQFWWRIEIQCFDAIGVDE